MTPIIIAELSCNHAGSKAQAMELVRAAAAAGADAVKLQTFDPEKMVLDHRYVITDGPWAGLNLIDLYRQGHTPWEWHKDLFDLASSLNLVAFSTAYHSEAVDFLETLNCPIYKVASFEITDLELLQRIARTQKPVILSTGMATLHEIYLALEVLRSSGVTLLKCVSAYPAPPESMNLNTIPEMISEFGCSVGLSDHSLTSTAACAAVALGAMAIEKHLKLASGPDTPDGHFSLTPTEFARQVKDIRDAHCALGKVQYGTVDQEASSYKLRKSLYFNQDMRRGDIITSYSISCARPAEGLAPRHLKSIVGKRLKHDVSRGNPVTWEAIC